MGHKLCLPELHTEPRLRDVQEGNHLPGKEGKQPGRHLRRFVAGEAAGNMQVELQKEEPLLSFFSFEN